MIIGNQKRENQAFKVWYKTKNVKLYGKLQSTQQRGNLRHLRAGKQGCITAIFAEMK